jgi:hypothetical protein
MGSLVELSPGVWVVRSGGKPLANWSGLDTPCDVESPLQLRPTYLGDSQKAYKHRATGLTDKFEDNGDLSYFAEEFWRHLLTTGMDTIAYLPDPESAAMMSVVTHHSRFTLAHVTTSAAAQVQLYDTVDRQQQPGRH